MAARRFKLAVWKFASCDGCQLSLLDLEDELLALARTVHIAHFLEASRAVAPGPYDLSIIDGSMATAGDVERIRQVRRISRLVVPIGACATAGGIQSLRNFADVRRFAAQVYPRPAEIDALPVSSPVAAHVPVDFELHGCPPDRHQLLETVLAFAQGRRPAIPTYSVCVECKLAGNVCVMVTGIPCLGPVTRSGCGALCPSYERGCYGCFGPMETPNTRSLACAFAAAGASPIEIRNAFRTHYGNAEAFRREGDRHGG